jgi:hypothetical protein
VRLRGAGDGRGVVEWSLRATTLDDTVAIDALPTRVATSAPCAPASHANGATTIDHVVIATPNWPRTIDALGAAGFDLRRERDAGGGMRQGFFRAGEVIIEIVGPQEVRDADGAARFFGLALNVADLDATKAFFGDRLSDPKPAVQAGRRIATLRHRDIGISTAIAFMSA